MCVEACPDDALEMVKFGDVAAEKSQDWDYAIKLNYLDSVDGIEKKSVKGSQFQQPLLEFHGMLFFTLNTNYFPRRLIQAMRYAFETML